MALLHGVAWGDEAALAALYDRHAGWPTVRMTRRCAVPDMVDHAVQDTFLALRREAGAYRGSGDVAAFIRGIGIRRLIDLIRRAGARRRRPRRAAEPQVVVSAGHGHGGLGPGYPPGQLVLPFLLVPVACAAFAVPGPGWLPAAGLLPSLAECAVALAAVTVVGPVPAAVLFLRRDRFESGWSN
jgi:hypothetical protein